MSKQRLAYVINDFSEGIPVVQDSRIAFANPRTEHLVDRSQKPLRGQLFIE